MSAERRYWHTPRIEELATDRTSARRIIRAARRVCIRATISSSRVAENSQYAKYMQVTKAAALKAVDEGFAQSALHLYAQPHVTLDVDGEYCWIGGC